MQKAAFSFGPGDGIVLTASALGLTIKGGPGIPGLANQLVMKVDLGPVGHRSLLAAAATKIADVLTDRQAAAPPGLPMKGENRQQARGAGREAASGFPLKATS